MFTLAQYVFGIGKSPDTIDHPNCASTDTAHHFENNDDSNQCVQTNIENDWILIELEQDNSNSAQDEAKCPPVAPRKAKLKSSKSKPLEKLQSQEESWFVDPPECFKNTCADARDLKTSSLENLLIEHPSMSVFDNLFIKRASLPKADQSKKQPLKAASKKSEACKENALAVRSNKKKVESVSVNVLAVSNQNKAFTAVIQSAEAFNKKKSITKKNYERQNKVAIQRNGPIIRHKKMFTHLNGVYHTRHNC